MEKTPEGFLLCRDVAISRTGTFDYSAVEGGIPAGEDGLVHLSRRPEDLFTADAIRSFEGKPVVIGHSTFVDPRNWKQRSIGIAQNVRRGEGENADKLLADLLITDQRGIDLVERGDMREVSCGYDAKPIDDGGGRGHQVGFVGNHVALVQQGRCGAACKIRDGAMTNLKTALRRFFKDGDEEKFNEALDDLKIEKVEEKVEEKAESKPEKSAEERLDALEALVKGLMEKLAEKVVDEKKAEGEVEKKAEEVKAEEVKTEETKVEDEDAKPVADEDAKACLDAAEEVCPGMKRPTADAKDGHFTAGALKRVKRQALKGAGVTAFGDAATLDGAVLDTAFKAAVLMARSAKNPVPAKAQTQTFGDSSLKSRPSNGQLNSLYNNFWKKA